MDYLVITAAGQGSRFQVEGFDLPKPLVLFKEKPLFYWAVESALNSISFRKVLFVVQKIHEQDFSISSIINSYYPDAQVIIIDTLTRGAAETAYISTQELEGDCSVAFLDCDLIFTFPKIDDKELWEHPKINSGLCTFESQSPNYSYIEIKDEEIVGVKEKVVVSNSAIAGFYLFRTVDFFKKNYLSYIAEKPKSEFYMSGLFNKIAISGGVIRKIDLIKHVSLGTPQELELAKSF